MQSSPALLSLLPWPWALLMRVWHRKPIATDAPCQPPLSPLPLHTHPLTLCTSAPWHMTSWQVSVPPQWSPFLVVSCLRRQRPLACELPARPLASALWGWRGATREMPGPGDLAAFGVLGMAASGCLGFGARTIRWGCFPGDTPVLSDNCVFSCASREARPAPGIAKERLAEAQT